MMIGSAINQEQIFLKNYYTNTKSSKFYKKRIPILRATKSIRTPVSNAKNLVGNIFKFRKLPI